MKIIMFLFEMLFEESFWLIKGIFFSMVYQEVAWIKEKYAYQGLVNL